MGEFRAEQMGTIPFHRVVRLYSWTRQRYLRFWSNHDHSGIEQMPLKPYLEAVRCDT